MEKGKLIVTKSKKGFRGEIEFLNSKGKLSRLAITSYKFNNDSLNGNDCYFKRVGGQLVELSVNGIKLIPSNVNKPKRNLPSFNNSVNLWATNNKYLRMPSDTAEIIDMNVVDNYSLKLNKLAHFFSVEKSSLHAPSFNDNPNLYISEFDNKAEKKSKDDKSKYLKYFNIFSNFGDFDFNLKVNNNLSTAKALFKTETAYKAITFKPNWRMVVGLGGESVYETSITLHHIYGIPYIPASSIKGVVRSWIITEVFGKNDLHFAEGHAIENKSFCDIFGCPAEIKIDNTKFESYYTKSEGKKKGDRKGKIIFLDAFPTTEPKIEVDIMNVHYPKYYGGNIPPTDTQSPNPIPFLTVAKTNFQFILGTKEGSLLDLIIENKTIIEWLKEALEIHGIGAKTAVGYGRLATV